eukprot:GHUV01058167.1.p1 GENE.GHUV01058167.1~~GHUV01058167.1.p1  ORF type:complete len:135 (-),score=4.07 GHUV01058167.1:43-447(-)
MQHCCRLVRPISNKHLQQRCCTYALPAATCTLPFIIPGQKRASFHCRLTGASLCRHSQESEACSPASCSTVVTVATCNMQRLQAAWQLKAKGDEYSLLHLANCHRDIVLNYSVIDDWMDSLVSLLDVDLAGSHG